GVRHHRPGRLSQCDENAHLSLLTINCAAQFTGKRGSNILPSFDRDDNSAGAKGPIGKENIAIDAANRAALGLSIRMGAETPGRPPLELMPDTSEEVLRTSQIGRPPFDLISSQ